MTCGAKLHSQLTKPTLKLSTLLEELCPISYEFNHQYVSPFFLELKNTQDQIIQLQHIIQLLPLINRDTLYVLLQFLGLVAEHAEDRTDDSGRTNFKFMICPILFSHYVIIPNQIMARIDKFCP